MWVPCGSEREGEGVPLRVTGLPGHLAVFASGRKGRGKVGWTRPAQALEKEAGGAS